MFNPDALELGLIADPVLLMIPTHRKEITKLNEETVSFALMMSEKKGESQGEKIWPR